MKNSFLTVLLGMFSFCQAQLINHLPPFTFTATNTFIGQINAIAEDTLTDFLHFQNSCICGVGPGNVWSVLSYANLNTGNVKLPYTLYSPWGTRYISEDMHAGNGKLVVNDKDLITGFNTPSYSQQWVNHVGTGEKILASVRRHDTVFSIIDDGSLCNSLQLKNANTGATIPYNTLSCTTAVNGSIFGEIQRAKIAGNKIYLAGSFLLLDSLANPLDTNLIAVDISSGQVVPLNWGINDTITDIELYNNKIHVAGKFNLVKGQLRNHYAVLDTAGNLFPGTPSFNGTPEEIEVYDNYLFALGNYSTINGVNVNGTGNAILKAVNLNNNTIMSWNLSPTWPAIANDDFILKNVRNRLYTVSRKQSYNFIDCFCLPPVKSTSIIATASTTICEQTSNVQFSIPKFMYASAYNWQYTGTGATLVPNSNSLTVSFAAGAASGKIKVVGVSACGGSSDTLSLNITILPRPGAVASLIDDTINCFKPKVPILGSSPSSGVGYQWGGPVGYFSNQQNDSTGKFIHGTYVLTVTKLATGCTSTASLTFKLDTLKPNVTLPLPPYIIPCNPNYISLNGTSSTTPSVIQWKNAFGTTMYPNPYPASVVGTYLMYVKDMYNGCIDSKSITVTASTAVPTVAISSHTNYVNAIIPADSISCYTPSVQLTASAIPANCSIVWKDVATAIVYANPITVSSQGNYMPIVTRLDNSCVDSSKIVYIKQNTSPPNVSVLTPSPAINCSFGSATLSAFCATANSNLIWTGPGSFLSTNPAVTAVQGKYYCTATNTINGCVKIDSVNVGYAPVLIVNAGRDTTVCKNSPVTFNAVVAGTVSPISYMWSNGSNSQLTTVSNSITTNYIIQVSGAGCTGTDTVRVIIPSGIQDSIVSSKGCTGNSGNLVVYAKGGIPPYVYSLNGGIYTSVNTFSNLAFATYTIAIKDSIGCVRIATAGINQNSNTIQADFIASTKNFKGDTVVFVDLTSPKADSIQWILPAVATKIGGDMYNPVIVFADTGSFQVSMHAFYASCMISATKIIHILPEDSAYATLLNNNGIKTLNLFPNPNSGLFTVYLEFYKKQNASIQVWDSSSQKYFQNNFIDIDTLSLPVSLPQLQNGTYILRVIGEYCSKTFNFVISK